ncbi:MAG: hypothetical protein Q8928_11340 [Bacteroidota bacterium]|nr:hypothetical protein [Bacteroidota bacterium]
MGKLINGIILIAIVCCFYGRAKAQNKSIYEIGDSISCCETNFENLIHNWTTINITNACEYRDLGYSFVETITDSVRYNYYRNYFSGAESVYSSTSSHTEEDTEGHKTSELYIWPNFLHSEIYDTRGYPEKFRMLLSEDFRQKAKNILIRDFNIDTMKLNYYSYEYNKKDTIIELGPSFNSFGINKYSSSSKVASPDSISKNYIDIFIKGKRKIEELSTKETRYLLLEQILIERINAQLIFNGQVRIGDKVYVVKFRHRGRPYLNYVICSAESKKVVMDSFLKGVMLDSKKDNRQLIIK